MTDARDTVRPRARFVERDDAIPKSARLAFVECWRCKRRTSCAPCEQCGEDDPAAPNW